ncbi:MAG: flagellar biosynthesis anti-sigma factor FlgM [Candidatus Goldiibacteriota bacterium]
MADNNIGGINPFAAQNILEMGGNKKTSEDVKNDKNETGAIGDKVEISRQAKTIGRALTIVNQMDEVRDDAVKKAVQNKVQENRNVPAEAVSAKLLIED